MVLNLPPTFLIPRQIYPADANVIVSLLDIHVEPIREGIDITPLEILEVGTGHGSLTMHLARAIHAANVNGQKETNPSDNPSKASLPLSGSSTREHQPESSIDRVGGAASAKAGRQAVIHTLDISREHSQHAQRIINGFRQGMYSQNIDFHVGDLSSWIDSQLRLRNLNIGSPSEFLSHVLFDVPNAHHHIEQVPQILHTNGCMIVFSPSISQIMTVVDRIEQNHMPLEPELFLELGPGEAGGREWDVRSLRRLPPRQQKEAIAESHPDSEVGSETREVTEDESDENRVTSQTSNEIQEGIPSKEELKMICRRKVGNRVTGGGYLGFWRKIMHSSRP